MSEVREPFGLLTARALRGAWRVTPPTSTLTPPELEHVAAHLLATGAGALGSAVARATPALAGTPAAAHLADAHRLHRLQALLHEKHLENVLQRCDALGFDPLLVKGWTTARHYPQRGLRPYGDVDLVLEPAERARLAAALRIDPLGVEVDLCHRFIEADGEGLAALATRARRIRFGNRLVRVLGAEDELRLSCVHYLRAGGWRALSLCDVALLLETAPPELDWGRVMPAGRRRGWVRIVAGLADTLLGADLSYTPLAGAAATVPPWVQSHIARGFATTPAQRGAAARFVPTLAPGAFAAQLRDRWPDLLEVAVHRRRALRPRPPIDVLALDLTRRAVVYLGAGAIPPDR